MRKQNKIAFCMTLTLCFLLLFCSCGTSLRDPSPAGTLDTPLTTHLLEGLLTEQETISFTELVTPVTEEDLRLAFSHLLASRWELYFVSQEYTLKKEGERVLYMRPQYLFSKEIRKDAEQTLHGKIDGILSDISPTFTPLEVVFSLHDYLITHFDYDDTHRSYDIYTMLDTGVGVCQAYALLFKALCEKQNIPCEVVLCFDMQHEWNMVKLYGNWYHIDLTWDETELPYLGRVLHRYFLLDDATLRERRGEANPVWKKDYLWDAPHPATDTTFSHMSLPDVYGRTVSKDGSLFFATTNAVMTLDPDTLTLKTLFKYPKKDEGFPFVTLVLYQDAIYFNLGSSLWRISGEKATLLGSSLPEGYYYCSISVEDGTLLAQIKH
jgi:hypothetical protein